MDNATELDSISDECFAPLKSQYNIPFHAFGVAMIFLASVLGTGLPVIWFKRGAFSSSGVSSKMLRVLKAFGNGVIISTAYVHMFLEAIESLTSPCLPEFFNTTYPGLGPFLTLVATLLMHLLDYSGFFWSVKNKSLSNLSRDSNDVYFNQLDLESKIKGKRYIGSPGAHGGAGGCCGEAGIVMMGSPEWKKKKMSLFLLEGGIAIHSIIIGIALGMEFDDKFTTLLIAIAFHQFFEGFSLGALLISIELSPFIRSFFILLYSLTTPIGCIIGIILAVYASPNPNSTVSLLSQGIMDALGAGILIYTALVELLLPEFRDPAFVNLDKFWRILCFSALWLGALSMSIIGIWA